MKSVWIWNHYAANMFFDRGGRHYCFAKYLLKNGYSPTVFCANTVHNSDKTVDIENGIYHEDTVDGIKFVFVRTVPYSGNGLSRILNMLVFARNVSRAAKSLAAKEKPDVILASSVHPLTCAAGIKAARRLGIPCIAEIRDLWPESIVEYYGISRKNPVIATLYALEKWIYKKSDKIIFTVGGGADYIRERGWDGNIDMDKVFYINNGVDLEEFDRNAENYILQDGDLNDADSFKIVYTGSIRAVNNLNALLEAAKITGTINPDIKFLIYGDGNERAELDKRAKAEGIANIKFKSRVDKKYIPGILKRADANILHVKQTGIMRFGCSMNKLFEYFAAGKPVLSDLNAGFDQVGAYSCGIVASGPSPEAVADAAVRMAALTPEEYDRYCDNARRAAADFDYEKLTTELIEVINRK